MSGRPAYLLPLIVLVGCSSRYIDGSSRVRVRNLSVMREIEPSRVNPPR